VGGWGEAAADTGEVSGGTEETGIGHGVARYVELETAEVIEINDVTVTEMAEEGLFQFAENAEDITALEAGVVLNLTGDIIHIERGAVDGARTVEWSFGIGGFD
jgi:hypothetical protein